MMIRFKGSRQLFELKRFELSKEFSMVIRNKGGRQSFKLTGYGVVLGAALGDKEMGHS